jgi:hypothetical protein
LWASPAEHDRFNMVSDRLRHEAVSRFFEKGLNMPEVAAISGHDGFRIIASNCKIEVLSVFQDKGRDSRQSTFRVDEACRGF